MWLLSCATSNAKKLLLAKAGGKGKLLMSQPEEQYIDTL